MVLVMSLLLSAAIADVGPPPSCGKGKHNEYCQGQQCVTDGYTLDENCEEIVDPNPPESSGCATSPGAGFVLAAAALLAARRR